MEKIKTIALISAAVIVTMLPVAILIATAVMNEYGAFGWAVNIAFSLVFMAFSWVMTKNEVTKYFMITTCSGSLMLIILVGVMSILCEQEEWYAPAPTMWAIAYVTSTISAAMYVMGDWRISEGVKVWLFWCGFAMITAVAVWCTAYSIVGLCGAEMPKWCETVFLIIEGTAIFIGCVRSAIYTIVKATNNGLNLSARCLYGSCALCCAAIAILIGYCALISWGINMPTAIEEACGYLLGAGIIGIILSFGIMLIETYLYNRKAKKYRN